MNGKVDLQACKSINEETGAEEQDSSQCIYNWLTDLIYNWCVFSIVLKLSNMKQMSS